MNFSTTWTGPDAAPGGQLAIVHGGDSATPTGIRANTSTSLVGYIGPHWCIVSQRFKPIIEDSASKRHLIHVYHNGGDTQRHQPVDIVCRT